MSIPCFSAAVPSDFGQAFILLLLFILSSLLPLSPDLLYQAFTLLLLFFFLPFIHFFCAEWPYGSGARLRPKISKIHSLTTGEKDKQQRKIRTLAYSSDNNVTFRLQHFDYIICALFIQYSI